MQTQQPRTAPSATASTADGAGGGAQAVCVDPLQVRRVWPHVAHLIERAIARGGLSDFEAVAADVLAGRSLLWLAWDGAEILAAAVTEIGRDREGRRLCTIVGCGGHVFERWGFLVAELERYARAEDCAAVVIMGRKGWQRQLPSYRVQAIVLEKELA